MPPKSPANSRFLAAFNVSLFAIDVAFSEWVSFGGLRAGGRLALPRGGPRP